MRRPLVLVALVFSLPAQAVTIDWVAVGNPNNLADTPSTNCWATNCGSVDHAYYISKYEVTNAQYAEFLNAKASSDPLGLYNECMNSDASNGGITQSGVSGSFTYAVKLGFENKPVTYVSFYDALRFSNWLHNGKGNAPTETGAYTLLGGTATPSNGLTVTRNTGPGPGAITRSSPARTSGTRRRTTAPAASISTTRRATMRRSRARSRERRRTPRTATTSSWRSPRWGRTRDRRAHPVRSTRAGTCGSGTRRSSAARIGASGAGAGAATPATSPRRTRTTTPRRARAAASVFVSRVSSPSPARDCSG